MIITDKFILAYGLRAGMEELQQDLNNLEKFYTARLSVGVESLDDPFGSLIVAGMVAKYPVHFKVGSGLEGIGNLIESLKKGIAGLKKLGRGKTKPVLDKQTQPILNEVNKTYASPKWAEDQTSAKGSVSISPIVKLVGGAKDYDELVNNVNAAVKFYKDAVADVEKKTEAYWNKVEPFLAKAKKAKGDGIDSVLTDLLKAVPETADKTLTTTSVVYEPKSGNENIFALSKENLTACGKLIAELFSEVYNIEEIAEDARINYGWSDRDFDGLEEGKLEKALWYRGFWEDLTTPVTEFAEDAAKQVLGIAKALEQVIVVSIK